MKIARYLVIGCLGLALLLAGRAAAVDVPLNLKESTLKFTGHTPTHDFSGQAKVFNGTAQVDPQKPQIVLGAKIEIKVANLTTDSSSRDSNMLKWFDATVNPTLTFQLTTVKATKGDPAAATKEKPAEFTVGGNFTMNKATKPLEAAAQGWREGKWLVVTGKTKLDTTLYGLPTIGASIAAVDKNVDVEFRLVFDLPAELQLGAAPASTPKPADPAAKPADPAAKPATPPVTPAPAAQPRAGG